MPHQCVRCNTFYDDGAKEILEGCACGAKLFFYIKKEKLKEMQSVQSEVHLSDQDKKQIEKDVFDLVGQKQDPDQPIVLDIESIRIVKPGKYELDLVHLFKGEPLIFKLGEGKYMIDVIQSFKRYKE